MKASNEKEIAGWKTVRAKGMWSFVFKFALATSLAGFIFYTVWDYVFEGILILRWLYLVFIFLLNSIGAVYLWKSREAKFKNYINDDKIENKI